MKINIRNVLACGMVLAVFGSTVAFASTTKDVLKATTSMDTIAKAAPNIEKENKVESFISTEGVLTEISEVSKDGTRILTISNEQGGLRFNVYDTSIIIDRETDESISANKLVKGMIVTVIYPELSPMGMSLPPFLGNVTVVVANSDKGNYTVGFFDDALLDAKNQLQLNIGEDTVLTHSGKSKIGVTPDMLKGQNSLVFYTSTTRSIPAQTTPTFVMLLDSQMSIDSASIDELKEKEQKTDLVPLRATATAKKFSVTWQGKENAILVKNQNTLLEITMNKAAYTIDGVKKEAAQAAILVDGITYISSDILG